MTRENFKLKITMGNQRIISEKGYKISDFDPIMKTLKKKFG